MAAVLVANGPNLNRLGQREPAHYGSDTLESIHQRLRAICDGAGVELQTFQTQHEGELVERIHVAADAGVDFIVINPAAFTHTSVALRDALLGAAIPFIEVHLSNVHAREPFRRHSYLADAAVGVIAGLGAESYEFAVRAALRRLGHDA